MSMMSGIQAEKDLRERRKRWYCCAASGRTDYALRLRRQSPNWLRKNQLRERAGAVCKEEAGAQHRLPLRHRIDQLQDLSDGGRGISGGVLLRTLYKLLQTGERLITEVVLHLTSIFCCYSGIYTQ